MRGIWNESNVGQLNIKISLINYVNLNVIIISIL